jgi:hypothetical protein
MSFSALLLSIVPHKSSNTCCNVLRGIKIVPRDHEHPIEKKEAWPLNWVPPKHLRMDRYIYPDEESCMKPE